MTEPAAKKLPELINGRTLFKKQKSKPKILKKIYKGYKKGSIRADLAPIVPNYFFDLGTAFGNVCYIAVAILMGIMTAISAGFEKGLDKMLQIYRIRLNESRKETRHGVYE
jgi:hypothetical protein